VLDVLLEPVWHLFRAADRIYWVYLFSAAVIAFFLYMRREHSPKDSLADFVRWCLPKHIWQHQSVRTDLGFFVVNRILFLVCFMPLVALLFPWTNQIVQSAWLSWIHPPNFQAETWVFVFYSLIVFLGLDLIRYFAHYLQHKIDFLWQFHRLHHSAEVLTPLTVYRMHPVDDLLPLVLASVFLAIVHGSFSVWFVDDFTFYTFGLVSLTAIVFYLLGYCLRHSHVWLSYGPKVSRWLISPAQHQIHHSSLDHHRDRNLGFMLAIWDRLFHTLYVPQAQEPLKLGVEGVSSARQFSNPWRCYVEPFQRNSERPWVAGLLFVVLLGGASVSVAIEDGWFGASKPLQLSELTSPEVADLIADGYKRVVVPTGGVEYNGAHLALGKHNRVVSFAALAVAQELGKTLVAPVIDFVPEGQISPPSGHMVHAGTISVRVETFEAILEDVTRSLIQHGFEEVLFIGDSGWNQQPQASVAERLNTEFASSTIQIFHLNDYYAGNDQVSWLEEQGFNQQQVGFHAGLRDSSELLFVDAKQVRMKQLFNSGQTDNVSGVYWKASKTIGEKMLQLKVNAALRQFESLHSH